MGESKKIGAHLLEDELAKKLTQKVGFDDLDPTLRTFINNSGTAPSGYDDTDLRTRIINIEDKMARSTVESDISSLQTKVNKNTNDILNLDSKKMDKTEVENRATSISLSDLKPEVRNKINAAYSYYQGILPSGNLENTTDLATLIATVNDLKDKAATKTEVNQCLRNSDSIPIGMLEPSARDVLDALIKKSIAGDTGSYGGGGGGTSAAFDEEQLNQIYRRNDDKIKKTDLDDALYSYLESLATGTDMGELIDNKANEIASKILEYPIGNFIGESKKASNGGKLAGETDVEWGKYSYPDSIWTSAVGGHKIGDRFYGATFDIKQQRQIIELSNMGSDTYKLVDVLYWMYYRMIGDQFRLTTSEFQEAVCNYSNDISKHGRYNGVYSRDQLGIKYNYFSLVDAIIYLTGRIRRLEEYINQIKAGTISDSDRTPSART